MSSNNTSDSTTILCKSKLITTDIQLGPESRSVMLNILKFNCRLAKSLVGCDGIPSLAKNNCKNALFATLSKTNTSLDRISFEYESDTDVMEMSLSTGDISKLQNLCIQSYNTMSDLRKFAHIDMNKFNKDAKIDETCAVCTEESKMIMFNIEHLAANKPYECILYLNILVDLIKDTIPDNKSHCAKCRKEYVRIMERSLKNMLKYVEIDLNELVIEQKSGTDEIDVNYAHIYPPMYNILYQLPISMDNEQSGMTTENTTLFGPYNVKGYNVTLNRMLYISDVHESIPLGALNEYKFTSINKPEHLALVTMLADTIRKNILDSGDMSKLDSRMKGIEEARREAFLLATQSLKTILLEEDWSDINLTKIENAAIIMLAVDEIVGYGIITCLLMDPYVTDIEIKDIGDDEYRLTCRHIKSRPRKECIVPLTLSKTFVNTLVENIIPRIAHTTKDSSIFIHDTLETAGVIAGVGKVRIVVNRPPLVNGYHIEIRKHSKHFGLFELYALGEGPPELMALLWMVSLIEKLCVMYAGRVGTGKTTVLIAGQASCPNNMAWAVVGDIDELHGLSGDTILFKSSGDKESRDEIRKKFLRKRKTKTLLQEIRDEKDAEDYIKQTLQGDAIIATTHANSASGLMRRFEYDFDIEKEYLYPSMDIIVILNERGGKHVIESVSYIRNDGRIIDIVKLDINDLSFNAWKWGTNDLNSEQTIFETLNDFANMDEIKSALRAQPIPMSAQNFSNIILCAAQIIEYGTNKLFDDGMNPQYSNDLCFEMSSTSLQLLYSIYDANMQTGNTIFDKDIAFDIVTNHIDNRLLEIKRSKHGI